MQEIGAFEAKNTLGSLWTASKRARRFVITRHGKPVARLVPNRAGSDRSKAEAAPSGSGPGPEV